jgi:hypothetical protein
VYILVSFFLNGSRKATAGFGPFTHMDGWQSAQVANFKGIYLTAILCALIAILYVGAHILYIVTSFQHLLPDEYTVLS